MNNKKLIILGCGGHARSVLDVVLYNNSKWNDVILVDENANNGETMLGFPIIKAYDVNEEDVFVAIGNNDKRSTLSVKYYNNLVSIISDRAYIGHSTNIGKGVFIAHNAHVGVLSQVNDFSLINTSASVDHDCYIGKSCFIAPNATLCGKVHLGENVFIGAGATIIDSVRICDNVTIGAGAIIIKNIEKPGIYVGNPVKEKKLYNNRYSSKTN